MPTPREVEAQKREEKLIEIMDDLLNNFKVFCGAFVIFMTLILCVLVVK